MGLYIGDKAVVEAKKVIRCGKEGYLVKAKDGSEVFWTAAAFEHVYKYVEDSTN